MGLGKCERKLQESTRAQPACRTLPRGRRRGKAARLKLSGIRIATGRISEPPGARQSQRKCGSFAVAGRAILITNNPSFPSRVPAGVDVLLLDGGARDVLITARDRVHQGWRLANHPLYGNFRPHQQPYRSLLLLPPKDVTVDTGQAASRQSRPSARSSDLQPLRQSRSNGFAPVDPDSLHFLEEALQLYQIPAAKVRQSLPGDLPGAMRRDCALLDCELLKATLESLH